MVGLFLALAISAATCVETEDATQPTSDAVNARPLPPKPAPLPTSEVEWPRPRPHDDHDQRILPRPHIPSPRDTPRFYPLRRIFRAGVEAICGALGFVGLFPKAILFIEGVVLLGMIAFVACVVFGLVYLLKQRL